MWALGAAQTAMEAHIEPVVTTLDEALRLIGEELDPHSAH